MEISRILSNDIVTYLSQQKGYSYKKIAEILGEEESLIRKVTKLKVALTQEHLQKVLDFEQMRFWEFAIEAIPRKHLSEKAYNRIELCKQLADHLKKRKNG